MKKTIVFGLSGVLASFTRDSNTSSKDIDTEFKINLGSTSYKLQVIYRPQLFKLLFKLKQHFELILFSDLTKIETLKFIKVFEK